ncbi:MAG: hypothetical protein IJ776_02705 [Paludibacteraceae bacterium]|nr:hypothetical protein [Paludibacteraceae bacterium]
MTQTIPYCPAFEGKSIEQVNALLDDACLSLSIDKVNWQKQFPYKPLTSVMLARTDDTLFIKWHVNGIMLKAVYTEDNSDVYKDSCVEFFCLLPDGKHYINLEFNCIGTCSASRRLSRTEDVQHLQNDELKLIKRYSSLGRRPFCEIDGQFTWDLCVAVPFSILGIDGQLPRSIRCNFYKCADGTSAMHYLSWAPIDTPAPDFHRPEFFKELFFN